MDHSWAFRLGRQFNSGRCVLEKFGLIVIMGAQWLCKPRVGVRSPVGPPNFNPSVAQLENVPSYEVERWGFESLRTDHTIVYSSSYAGFQVPRQMCQNENSPAG